MRLDNRVYDLLKKVAQIWLPAVGTLYFALAQIWHLPAAVEVGGTIVAVDTFLGVILGISSASYNNSDAAHDGTMWVTTNDEGKQTGTLDLTSHPEAMVLKPSISLKVQHVEALPSAPVA
jgi:hypothetical protein